MKIDKCIPIPASRVHGRGHGDTGLAFRAMEPGDSIFFPNMKPKYHGGLSARAKRACRDLPLRKWTVRQVTEKGTAGLRIWRVE